MDMMDTIELKTIKEQAKKVVEELLEAAKLREGQILVVGCSSSEIDSFRIGSHPVRRLGKRCLRRSTAR